MGWLFSPAWPTKQDLVKHLLEDNKCTHSERNPDGSTTETRGTYRTIAHAIHGSHLWSVIEYDYPTAPKLNTRFIALFLMQSGGRDGWGYKDLEESMGPCEVDCPLRFLDMVPPPDPAIHPYAAGWRENVRAFHAGKLERKRITKDIQPGQRWLLIPGCSVEWVRITEKAKKPGQWYAKTPLGDLVRVRTRLLARPMGEKEATASEFAALVGVPNLAALGTA